MLNETMSGNVMTNGKSGAASKTDEFAIEPFEGVAGGKATSIGAARRGRVERLRGALSAGTEAARPPAVLEDEAIAKDLEALRAAVREMQHAGLEAGLAERLGRIETRLEAVAESTSFTEAYVSVEMSRKMVEALDARVEAIHAATKPGRRTWLTVPALIAIAAFVLLGTEMYNNAATNLVGIFQNLR